MVLSCQASRRRREYPVAKPRSGLKKWFGKSKGGNWVDISAPKEGGGFEKCGRKGASDSDRGYPKCVPADKAANMSKKQIASAVSRKRSKKQGVGGKPTNVSTFAKNGGEIMKKGSNKAISVGDYERKSGLKKKKMPLDNKAISVDEFERQSGFKKKKLPLDNKAISVDDYERQTPQGLPATKRPMSKPPLNKAPKKTPATRSEKRPSTRRTAVMKNKGGTIKKPGGMKKGGAVKMKKPSSKNSGLFGR